MPSNKSECHDLETRDRTKVYGYEEWIRSIKERIQRARVKASMLVNSEQTLLYWDIGHDTLEKQESEAWGAKVVERMSADLKAAFPDMTGLSPRNLKYMRAFADAWARKEIVQAPLAQLPWYHHLALADRRVNLSTWPSADRGIAGAVAQGIDDTKPKRGEVKNLGKKCVLIAGMGTSPAVLTKTAWAGRSRKRRI